MTGAGQCLDCFHDLRPIAKAWLAVWLAVKNILLIDDVMTIGATLTSYARTLLHAGAASVSALVFARVA